MPGAPPRRIAALISSVGGLEATRRVLCELPADFASAVIVLQHSEPSRPSALAGILDRHTALRVRTAEDGAALLAGEVVVAPNGCHTLVTGGGVAVIRSGLKPPSRPSGDLLLTSLALGAGPRALAVVLSGTGHDGAAGIVAVKHLGGTVWASDLASSRETGMPAAAVDTEVVDAVLPLDDIGAALAEVDRGAAAA